MLDTQNKIEVSSIGSKLIQRFCVSFVLIASFCAFQFGNSAFADAANSLSSNQLQHLNSDTFEPLKSVSSWPDSVKDYYKSAGGGKDLSKEFADPGKPFAAGCSRTPDGPPAKSFMLGAKSSSLCIINYQIGGIALRDMVDIFELKDNSAQRIASKALYPGNASDLKQLLEQLRKDPILSKTH